MSACYYSPTSFSPPFKCKNVQAQMSDKRGNFTTLFGVWCESMNVITPMCLMLFVCPILHFMSPVLWPLGTSSLSSMTMDENEIAFLAFGLE